MAWYDEAVFYHIYPLGLTGAPKTNSYGEPEHRLMTLIPWISHIKEIGCNAIYIGPLFESVGHGYETTDYKKLDSRLGTNQDLADFTAQCHRQGVKVILDGVFNHTGRDFFAFQDIKKNRENSPYKDWYCNVNFWGNNEYNDGFSYENWGGYNLLVKLNQRNPAVRDYICDVIRFWVSEFDIDGIRLDAADVLDFDYMKAIRHVANEVKPEFWLMGEVIHGDYTRWVNEGTLHSVTNYHLHKALYSGHNDHNYFEIAHTVKRLYGMGGNRPDGLKLYNFVDNHDVERIYTKLSNKAHFAPVHVLLYTLPGVPSIYYGSEFGIEGRKERFSDDSLRPALFLSDFEGALENDPRPRLIAALGRVRQHSKALSYGDYQELLLTNRQYAFSRNHNGESVVVTVNNDDSDYVMTLPAGGAAEYIGGISGQKVSVDGGKIAVNVKANSGEIWLPLNEDWRAFFESADGKSEGKGNADAVKEGNLSTEGSSAVGNDGVAGENQQSGNNSGAEGKEESGSNSRVEGKEESKCNSGAEGEKESKCSSAAEGKEESRRDSNAEGKTESGSNFDAEGKMESGSNSAAEGKSGFVDNNAVQKDSAANNAIGEGNISSENNTAGAATVPQEVSQLEIYEKGKIAGLQEAIIAIMEKNGPVTDQMRRDVRENVYHDSLIKWIQSFR